MERRQSQNQAHHKQRGFSLSEILIAVAILAFSMSALLPIYAQSILISDAVRDRSEARLRLQSLLSEARAETPMRVRETSGVFDAKFSWRLAVAPEAAGLVPVELWRIRASVSWKSRGRDRTLTLTTLQVGARNAP